MKNKWIGALLIVIVLGVIAMVVIDAMNNRTGKRGGNPYKLEVDQYRDVDSSLILYKETRQIKLGEVESKGLAYTDGKLFVMTDSIMRILTVEGVLILSLDLDDAPRCIHANGDLIYIGFQDYVMQYHVDGQLISTWDSAGENTVITSIATKGETVFVADAGNRRVLRYDTHGLLESQFEGKRNADDAHGFVIPSGYFDLAVYQDELWVVNPGMHALENYTDDGTLRGFWEKATLKIEGFGGCCNPAQMTVDSEGNFITSEKGLVRIKIYKASGELIGVVAPPDKFEKNAYYAPEVAVNEQGVIFALDFETNMIRIFEKK